MEEQSLSIYSPSVILSFTFHLLSERTLLGSHLSSVPSLSLERAVSFTLFPYIIISFPFLGEGSRQQQLRFLPAFISPKLTIQTSPLSKHGCSSSAWLFMTKTKRLENRAFFSASASSTISLSICCLPRLFLNKSEQQSSFCCRVSVHLSLLKPGAHFVIGYTISSEEIQLRCASERTCKAYRSSLYQCWPPSSLSTKLSFCSSPT